MFVNKENLSLMRVLTPSQKETEIKSDLYFFSLMEMRAMMKLNVTVLPNIFKPHSEDRI
jgi:hypothetical protein